MANAVSPKYLLPVNLVDEAEKLIHQAEAVLECLNDGIAQLQSPEHVVPGITWLVRDHLARIKQIVNARTEV